ncbi:hypothetical protein [Nitrosopumilus spindle-shaped virus]|uniref:Uncharacterized protein n=1 Tax=Nitrosopumilus spindle-shaped virus TaxID=2508184 RepID=A0A514K5D6_9VIRU|nr:hypothetical protein [Nitrosopumilus spindle-shaped virus]
MNSSKIFNMNLFPHYLGISLMLFMLLVFSLMSISIFSDNCTDGYGQYDSMEDCESSKEKILNTMYTVVTITQIGLIIFCMLTIICLIESSEEKEDVK